MRPRHFYFIALLAGLLSLGLSGCGSSRKGKPASKRAKHPPTKVEIRQTGSNLSRTVTLADDEEDAEVKAKAKRKKKEPVDEKYLPRGGFR